MDRAARTYLGVRSAALVAGSRAPRRNLTGGSPEFTFPALRGLKQLVFCSRGYYASRVIHQRVEPGSGRLGAVGSTAAAALRGGARRSACARDVLGSGTCANECGRVRVASASQDRGNEGLRGAAASSPWRNSGSGTPVTAFRPRARPSDLET